MEQIKYNPEQIYFDPKKSVRSLTVYVVDDMFMYYFHDEKQKLKAIYVTDLEETEDLIKLLQDGVDQVKRTKRK